MKGCYYRKGAPVIYHYKEWRRVTWSDSGYGWVPAWKRCKVVCTPRNAYGQFTTDNCDMEFVTLKDEDGRIFQASMDDVEPDRDIETLSREELVKLWGEVCKGSIYLCDYRNSLGVFEYVASYCYDSFFAYLSGEYGEKEYRKELLSFVEESFALHKNMFELKPDGYETWEELCKEEQGLEAEEHIGIYLFPETRNGCVELYPTRIYRKESKRGVLMYYADGYDIDEDSFPTKLRLQQDKASLEAIACFINKCLEQESGKNRKFDKNEYVYVVGYNGETFEGVVSNDVTVDKEDDKVAVHRLVDGYSSSEGEMIKAEFVYQRAKGKRCPRCAGFLYHEHHDESDFLYYCPECKEQCESLPPSP